MGIRTVNEKLSFLWSYGVEHAWECQTKQENLYCIAKQGPTQTMEATLNDKQTALEWTAAEVTGRWKC